MITIVNSTMITIVNSELNDQTMTDPFGKVTLSALNATLIGAWKDLSLLFKYKYLKCLRGFQFDAHLLS